jgi:L,D-peptidoglycan transpeptidase YkuD (ErfK/YbiS/YcfS/YnhG family)
MLKIHKKQAGFSAVEAVLVLVVVAAIGSAGWYVAHSHKSNGSPKTVASTGLSPTATSSSGTGSSTPAAATGPTSTPSLDADLSSAEGSNDQSAQDLNSSNAAINDQPVFTASQLPQ